MTTYRSLVVRGPGSHGLEPTERPSLPAGHVRLRVAAVAFCGTDHRLLRGQLHDARYPVVPGHEWAGYVIESPEEPDLVGALTVASIYVPCERCEWCAASAPQHCTDLGEYGFTLPGGCAEEVVVRRSNVRRVPVPISPVVACVLEPLTVAIHAIDQAPPLEGREVVVLGGGAMGLLLAQLVLAAGGRCTVVEPRAGRRELAQELGAAAVPAASDLPDSTLEVVVDATGAPPSFAEAVRLLRPTGTLLLVGYSGEDTLPFAPSSLMLKEITVVGVLSGVGTLDRAIDAVVRGTVRLDPLLGPPIPFDDYATLLEDGQERPPRQPMLVATPPGRAR